MSKDPMYDFIEKMGSEYLGDFKSQLDKFTSDITSEHIRMNSDLNALIAGVAKKHNLNPDQIQRIIEEVNNSVHLYYYNKQKNNDVRDVRFPIARKSVIDDMMSKPAPKTGDIKKTAFFGGADADFEKVASEQPSQGFSMVTESLSPIKIRDRYSERQSFELKLAIENANEQLEKQALELKDGLNKISSVIIKNELLREGSASEIASFLTKEASVRFIDLFEQSFSDTVQGEIRQGNIPEDFETNLHLTEKRASEFSLGKYSFLDEKPRFTSAVVNGQIFDSIDSLKKTAGELSDKFDKGLQLREKVARIVEQIKSKKRGY